jgi:hypothetical protein
MNNQPQFVKTVSRSYFSHINESKLVIGVAMILLNIGSKYVDFKFSKAQEQLLRTHVVRELLIFTIVFMGTRDITYAILLTAAFIFLSEFAFNEKSKYCVVPERMKQLMEMTDTNKDGIITPEEEARALATLKQAEKNRDRDIQHKFSTYMNNTINTMNF